MQKYIQKIEEKRISKGFSGSYLCHLSGVNVCDYSYFMSNKGVSFENLNKLRDALGMIGVADEINMQIKKIK